MATSKSHSGQGDSRRDASYRLVYTEFGPSSSPSEATARPELPPQQQQLKVQASRKGRKGKTVTVITGFQSSAETLTALCKQLKAQCGAGGTVKEQTIEVQGDHGTTVTQFLTQSGYKVKLIAG